MIKVRETFYFNPPVQVKEDSMIGLTSLEVYNSIFNIAEGNNKFQFYTDPPDSEFSFTELKDKIPELLDISHITPEDLEQKHADQTLLKITENYRLKKVRLKVTIYYYWVILNHHFEVSKHILEF